jgi:hypothetical protein
MTERRSPYHTFSGEYSTQSRPISPSPLVQHHTDGTTSRDTIYLLPLLASAGSPSSPSSCLQHVHLPNGDPAFCCRKTEQACTCCGADVCKEHQRIGFLHFQDETGCWHDLDNALLCQTCASLSKQMRAALHTFRRLLNLYEGVDVPCA